MLVTSRGRDTEGEASMQSDPTTTTTPETDLEETWDVDTPAEYWEFDSLIERVANAHMRHNEDLCVLCGAKKESKWQFCRDCDWATTLLGAEDGELFNRLLTLMDIEYGFYDEFLRPEKES
jgi:hypothetical protein